MAPEVAVRRLFVTIMCRISVIMRRSISSFASTTTVRATTGRRKVAARVEQGIRREQDEYRHLLGAVVDQIMLDTRGHDQGIQPLQDLALDFGFEMSVAFDDQVQRV